MPPVLSLFSQHSTADYIRRRSDRYPGAVNIEPGWTVDSATDPRRVDEGKAR